MRHPPPFNLIIVSPIGPVPEDVLAGSATMLRSGLARLGLPSRIVVNEYLRDATNILFAAFNLDPALIPALPRGTIVYNSEMVVPGSPFVDGMIPFVRAFETWDYSAANVRRWGDLGLGARVRHLQTAYLPEFTTVDLDAPRDVDVLFYGQRSPRRDAMVRAIADTGVQVRSLVGVYGDDLTRWMERSRIIVNIHHRDEAVFEFARLSLALANRRCFVSESGGEEDVDPALRPGYVSVPARDLAAACRSLVDDSARREAIARRGHELYRATDFTRNLARLLEIDAPG
jgi:hypothetical protein